MRYRIIGRGRAGDITKPTDFRARIWNHDDAVARREPASLWELETDRAVEDLEQLRPTEPDGRGGFRCSVEGAIWRPILSRP